MHYLVEFDLYIHIVIKMYIFSENIFFCFFKVDLISK